MICSTSLEDVFHACYLGRQLALLLHALHYCPASMMVWCRICLPGRALLLPHWRAAEHHRQLRVLRLCLPIR
jgi:hypothetical protein